MTKDEIKRRLFKRIDEDDEFASEVEMALEQENDRWLRDLIVLVIGYVIDAVFDWLRRLLSW